MEGGKKRGREVNRKSVREETKERREEGREKREGEKVHCYTYMIKSMRPIQYKTRQHNNTT